MKRAATAVLIAMLLLPGVALAGSSTDAALGLGAFAVFNQIISGTGIFGRPAPAAVAPPVVVERQVVVVPPPPPVVVVRPVTVYEVPAPVYYQTYVQYAPTWCPPGLAKHGRCGKHWRHRARWHDD